MQKEKGVDILLDVWILWLEDSIRCQSQESKPGLHTGRSVVQVRSEEIHRGPPPLPRNT